MSTPTWKTRFLNALPSWLYLVGGLAILGATVLVPTWLDVKNIEWQRQALERETQSYANQVERYEAMLGAIERRDPGLIRRLAQQQFNLNAPDETIVPVQTAALPQTLVDPYCVDPLGRAAKLDGLEALLTRTEPNLPPDPATEKIRESMVVRLTTGEHQMGLLAVGGIFFFVGLLRQAPITCHA